MSSKEITVSVVIPARDEEKNLPTLLRSLGRPKAGFCEWIVVDDGSQDRTAQIAQEHGATVIRALPLPKGWTGKAWACHQGALASQGKVLLFLDGSALVCALSGL
jgi:glycosyltransferase involved in cell wall biosynthesis